MEHPSIPLSPEVESRFADELDRITRQIQHGETPDVSQLVADYPDMAETIHAYVRQIELLQGAGGGSADERTSKESGEDAENELRIGDYRIEHELGRGGMGIVYAARQISLDRPVALKILPFASSLDKKQINRFRNEARAAGQLHHPNIVPVFAVGCEDEVHFYAMQQIIGESLDAVIRSQKGLDPGTNPTPTWLDTSPDEHVLNRNRLSESDLQNRSAESSQSFDPDATASLLEQKQSTQRPLDTADSESMGLSGIEKLNGSGTTAVSDTVSDSSFKFSEPASVEYHRQIAQIGVQVAEALQYAHECGIIHRDIKPSNLMLDRHGKVWVTDFGLARFQSDAGITRTGDVIGTLRYMSPEQASGDSAILDQRTDVYSLGITLYELITLHEAFHGIDRHELLGAIAEKDPVLPRRLNSSIPIDLETIVLKAVSKKPEQRYASAQELADDLERFLDGRPTLARRPTPTERLAKWAGRHRAAVRVAMVLVVVAMVGFGITSILIGRAHNRVVDANHRLNEAHTQLATALNESESNRLLAENNMKRAEASSLRAGANYRQARQVLDKLGSQYAEKLKKIDGAEELRQALLYDTLAYYDQFIMLSENDPTVSRDLALTYSKIGDISDQLGNQSRSLDSYVEAKQLLEKLISKAPEAPEHRADLALCLNNLGRLLDRMGKTNEARRQYETAIGIMQKLVEKYPEEDQYLADLALANYNRGRLNLQIGNLADAQTDLEVARDLLKSAIQQNPTDLNYASRLAASYDTLSSVFQVSNPKKAIQNCSKAIVIQKRLIQEHPQQRELQSDLALSYHNLGVLLRQDGQNKPAADSYRKAIDLLTSLVQRAPAVVKYRFQLAVSENNLGRLLSDLGQHVAAGKAFDNARLALTGLVRDYPSDPSYRSSLGGTLNNLGMTLEQLSRYADAAQTYYEAIKHQKDAHQLAPKVERYRQFLSKQYVNYARVLRTLKRYDEAYKVIQVRKQLWKGQPNKLLGVAGEMAMLVKGMDHSFPNPTPEQSAVHKKIFDSAVETLHEALDAGVLTPQALQGTAFDSLRKGQRFRELNNKLDRG